MLERYTGHDQDFIDVAAERAVSALQKDSGSKERPYPEQRLMRYIDSILEARGYADKSLSLSAFKRAFEKHEKQLINLGCPKPEPSLTPQYFVFEYYHDMENSALVLCVSDLRRMVIAPGFDIIPEEHRQEEWTQRCLDELVKLGVKEVFSIGCKNAMSDTFLGFPLHYSDGEKEFFHYDFVSPETWGDRFKERGIELREFKRD